MNDIYTILHYTHKPVFCFSFLFFRSLDSNGHKHTRLGVIFFHLNTKISKKRHTKKLFLKTRNDGSEPTSIVKKKYCFKCFQAKRVHFEVGAVFELNCLLLLYELYIKNIYWTSNCKYIWYTFVFLMLRLTETFYFPLQFLLSSSCKKNVMLICHTWVFFLSFCLPREQSDTCDTELSISYGPGC